MHYGKQQAKGLVKWTMGNNESGFSALPAGFVNYSREFENLGSMARFWSASYDDNDAIGANNWKIETFDAQLVNDYKSDMSSVRCVENYRDQYFNDDSTLFFDSGIFRPAEISEFPIGKKWINQSLEYGELYDERDHRTYKTIKIGNLVWMAENLNYADSASYPNLFGNNWCYNNDSTFCLKAGRFYSWTAAMNFDEGWKYAPVTEGMIETPHKGICPEGWHLPTLAEWEALKENVNYKNLQAVGFAQWVDADNESGFSALPIGFVNNSGDFSDYGTLARFWSATNTNEKGDNTYHSYQLHIGTNDMHEENVNRKDGYNIRCIKD
jgi:uncharacterized protein (TIGR02145 family)